MKLQDLLNEAGQTADGILAAAQSLGEKLKDVAEPEIASECATIERFADAFKAALESGDGEAATASDESAKIAELEAALAAKGEEAAKAQAEVEAAKQLTDQKVAEVLDVQQQLEGAQAELAQARAQIAELESAKGADLLLHNDAEPAKAEAEPTPASEAATEAEPAAE